MIHIYDSHYRGECRSERCEQIDAMTWQAFNYSDRAPLCFHVANEARGTAAHHHLRQKQGVKPGVPDIIDLSCSVPGLFEMKRLDRTKSSVSRHQKSFLASADAKGHFVAICYGYEQFQLAYAYYVRQYGGNT